MDKIYNSSGKKGMSLVEMIVAVALIGIISTMLATVFISGTYIAVNSGDNTFVAETANSNISEKIITQEGSANTASVDFNVNGDVVNDSFSVPGKYIEDEANTTKNQTLLKTFVPD